MAAPSVADQKLIQYLNEAYGLEQRLETALQAHIATATSAPYKKRLREHLTETKRHGREVAKRIKQLGGQATSVDAPGPAPIGEAAQAVLGGAQKALALAQGSLHAIRGTGEQEKQLKNAKSEYSAEAEEIATYSSIEALAATLGDLDTQRLARAIRREEERMLAYLQKQIPRFTKAVAKAEIPASQRGGKAKAKATSAKAKATSSKAKATNAKPKAKRAKAKVAPRRKGTS